MVELRTLTPSVLVRIQLPQPKIKTPLWRFYFWFVGRAVRPRDKCRLVRQRVDLTSTAQSNRHECPAGASRGNQLPQPRIQPAYSGFNYWLRAAQFGHATNIALVRQGVVEHKRCVVRNVTTAPLAPAKGIQLPQPR